MCDDWPMTLCSGLPGSPRQTWRHRWYRVFARHLSSGLPGRPRQTLPRGLWRGRSWWARTAGQSAGPCSKHPAYLEQTMYRIRGTDPKEFFSSYVLVLTVGRYISLICKYRYSLFEATKTGSQTCTKSEVLWIRSWIHSTYPRRDMILNLDPDPPQIFMTKIWKNLLSSRKFTSLKKTLLHISP